ncbi:MAG: GNAT family N-acetyltransferase [Clostridiales bacterium]|nr:GNAT family N-acetyltransferase [Clostridiales bacterium]
MAINIIRVTEEWQRAGVHYVRVCATNRPLQADIHQEFEQDTPDSRYILVLDDIYPVSTCRLRLTENHTARIERVATVPEYQSRHYGTTAIRAAEEWLKEQGVKKIYINSRTAVVGFYESLGYTPYPDQITGSGTFECILTAKEL